MSETPAPSPPIAKAIVVLGARVLKGGIPSSALRARAERAAELYEKGEAELLLCTGGIVGSPPAEAEVAAELLKQRGVPAERILLERNSRTTRENARHSARMLRERSIETILLVTDPFHLYRATRLFWREGVTVIPSPTDLTGRNMRRRDRLYWYGREAVSLLRTPTLLFARPPR